MTDDNDVSGRGRQLDPERMALWSIPLGAVAITVAFLAGSWIAAPRERPTRRPIIASAPVSAVASIPSYPVAPPPPPIQRPREPDSGIAISPAIPTYPAPPTNRIAPAGPNFGSELPAFAPSAPIDSAGQPAGFQPPTRVDGPRTSNAGAIVLPGYRPSSSDASSGPVDEETARLARAREATVQEEQARLERDRAQEMAAREAARSAAIRAAQARARTRHEYRSPASRQSGHDAWSDESRRRNDAFFDESDFRDERRNRGGW